MSELKLTLEPELESPSLGGVPTLTLDGAAEEKKPAAKKPAAKKTTTRKTAAKATTKKAAEKAVEKPTEKAAEKPVEKPAEEPVKKTAAKTMAPADTVGTTQPVQPKKKGAAKKAAK